MSTKIRSKKFHYRFMVAGVSYSGICKGCEIPPGASAREIVALKKHAEYFEASERPRISAVTESITDVSGKKSGMPFKTVTCHVKSAITAVIGFRPRRSKKPSAFAEGSSPA